MRLRWVTLALFATIGAAPLWAAPCAPATPCDLPNGRYVAPEPTAWDGHGSLPVLLFLHGEHDDGAAVLAAPAVGPVAAAAGFLLVAPDSADGKWSLAGAPRARDDVALIETVIADLRRRWPVDPRTIVAAGFSQGAAMVWRLACYDAGDFTAFLAFSGGLPPPLPKACLSGSVSLRQVHGTSDRTVPLYGATERGIVRQGNILQELGILRGTDGCASVPDRRETDSALNCEIWSRCSSGAQLELRRFPGGHEMQGASLAYGLAWARGLAH